MKPIPTLEDASPEYARLQSQHADLMTRAAAIAEETRQLHASIGTEQATSRHTDRVAALLTGVDYAPTAKGGRPRNSVSYTKDSLVSDFADARKRVFGADDKRRLMDARRSGAVEANAGGASVEALAAKMGNSIDENKKLQATYMPVNIAAVRAADDARRIGRKKLGEERNEFKKLKLGIGES